MKILKTSRIILFRFHCLLLLVALASFLFPDQAGAQTFTDNFDDTTTYLLPVNPNTKWRQVGAEFGIITSDIGSDASGYSVRLIDEHPGWGWPSLAADNAQQFDLSSIVLGAEIKPNSSAGGGGIGFGVYDDSGENLAAGIASGLAYHDVLGLSFMLYSMNAYEESPTILAAVPVSIDTDTFHTITMEMLDGEVSAELDGIWQISGIPHINIDVAGAGLWADDLSDFSFDNFSMAAQPDDRHVVFQDVAILEDSIADELLSGWSHDGKMIAFVRDEMDTGPWNVWVKSLDPPGPAVQRTQNEDHVWIFSGAGFSPDQNYILFTAVGLGDDNIKRVPADGSGPAETIFSDVDMKTGGGYINPSCNLMAGNESPKTVENWNLFSVEVTSDGLPVEETKKMLTDFPPGSPFAIGPTFDATCDRIVFVSMPIDDLSGNILKTDIYLLEGVQEIISGTALPPTDYGDPRLTLLAGGPNFKSTPFFSRNGSLVYYCEDVDGGFDYTNAVINPWISSETMFAGSHWEIFAVDPNAPGEGIKLNYYRPYDQGALSPSPDGTRLVFCSGNRDDGDGIIDTDLYIVALKVQEAIDASAGGQIVDGSGTTMNIPPDSLSEDTVVSIKTPLPGDMPSPDTLPGGLQNIALARVIEAESETATIDPENPPILTIHYTDEEIAGLDELSLRIYVYNDDTLSWEALEDCTVDPVTNTVSAPLPHLSTFCVSGALAGTLPVVGSFKAPLTTEEDFALQYGTTVPVKFDVRTPQGTFLPDEPVEAVITDSSVPPNKITTFVRGDGSEDIRVDEAAEQYVFNLHSKDYGLLDGGVYGIVILWNHIPIGEIDFTVDYTKGTGRGRNK